jgi:hypothetical protein
MLHASNSQIFVPVLFALYSVGHCAAGETASAKIPICRHGAALIAVLSSSGDLTPASSIECVGHEASSPEQGGWTTDYAPFVAELLGREEGPSGAPAAASPPPSPGRPPRVASAGNLAGQLAPAPDPSLSDGLHDVNAFNFMLPGDEPPQLSIAAGRIRPIDASLPEDSHRIPEPTSMSLLGVGCVIVAAFSRRRKRRRRRHSEGYEWHDRHTGQRGVHC